MGLTDRITRAPAACCFFLPCLLLASVTAVAQEPEEGTVEGLVTELHQAAEQHAPRLDRAQFDLDALLDRQNFDASSIIDFVSRNIATEVYPGALRGALGTLLGRAGNSLDQALLTATLLRDAGFDAVIRRGTLGDEDANRLIDAMFQARSPDISPWKNPADAPAPADPKGRAERRATWVEAARVRADGLATALDAAGLGGDPAELLAQLRRDAADYYWVDYRGGEAEEWVSVHPALAPAPAVTVAQTFQSALPAELSQRVRLEVFVDQRRGDERISTPLFDPIEWLGPELAGLGVTVTLLPDQLLNRDAAIDPQRLAADTRFILPLVGDGLPAGAMALTPQGNLVPADALALGNAEYFDTVSRKSTQAADTLAGLDGATGAETASQIALEAIRMRVTFLRPGHPDRVAERDWFRASRDLQPGSTTTDDSVRVMALARAHAIAFATGRENVAFLADTLFDEFDAMYALMGAAGSLDVDNCRTLACLQTLDRSSPKRERSANPLFTAFDDIDLDLGPGSVRYRGLPGMFIQSRPLLASPDAGPGAGQRLDIVSNAKQAWRRDEDGVRPLPSAQRLAGAWETLIETDAWGRIDASPPQAPVNGTKLVRIDRDQLGGAAANSPVGIGIRRDLDAGFAVFASPDLNRDGAGNANRWWRVDPLSGETLGMNPYGGATASEYTTLLGIAGALVATVGGYIGCLAAAVDNERIDPMQCLVCANFVGGPFLLALSAIRTIQSGAMDPLGYGEMEAQRLFMRCLSR